jgi:hypothetical protein
MTTLTASEIFLTPEAVQEWEAMKASAFMYCAVFQSDNALMRYHYEEAPDGALELSVEIQEQPFYHGMYLRIPPEHWRKRKGDA